MDLIMPPALKPWFSSDIPESRQLDIGFALFEFPRFEDLIDFQMGYRWHGITQARELARHGACGWKPNLLFTDLAQMSRCFNALAALISDAGDALFDDDDNIQPNYVELIKAKIVNHVGLEQGNQIVEQLEIMAY